MMVKRILGVIFLGLFAYMGYLKIGQSTGDTAYAGFFTFFIVVVLVGLYVVIRKILTY